LCFSAAASFGASAIILTIGVISIRKSTTIPQKVFSCIPLIFSIQQFVEGILWLSLSHGALSPWVNMATYGFLVFAEIVWPIFLPLSVFLLEKQDKRKRTMAVLLVLSGLVSFYLAYSLLFYGAEASISCYHIQYNVHYPIVIKHSGILYLVATVLPPIISSIKRLRLFGVIILLSYVVTIIFYKDYLISVWCYFAAVISVAVLSIVMYLNKPAGKRMQAGA
jgi:hypothetical protein